MPYQRASSRRPESIIEEWRGTCSGKHINEVLQGQNPQAFKEQPIAEFCGASRRIRDDFIEGMSRWLSEATQSQSKTSLTSKTSLRR